MTSRRSLKKQHELEHRKCLACRHAIYSWTLVAVGIAIAYFATDPRTVNASKVIAEVNAGAALYWHLFGSLELL